MLICAFVCFKMPDYCWPRTVSRWHPAFIRLTKHEAISWTLVASSFRSGKVSRWFVNYVFVLFRHLTLIYIFRNCETGYRASPSSFAGTISEFNCFDIPVVNVAGSIASFDMQAVSERLFTKATCLLSQMQYQKSFWYEPIKARPRN